MSTYLYERMSVWMLQRCMQEILHELFGAPGADHLLADVVVVAELPPGLRSLGLLGAQDQLEALISSVLNVNYSIYIYVHFTYTIYIRPISYIALYVYIYMYCMS